MYLPKNVLKLTFGLPRLFMDRSELLSEEFMEVVKDLAQK